MMPRVAEVVAVFAVLLFGLALLVGVIAVALTDD